ncbi:MAG: LPXTG cell wall anchor domain-containing protein, partial [Bacillus sp. (in: firmicutes)]
GEETETPGEETETPGEETETPGEEAETPVNHVNNQHVNPLPNTATNHYNFLLIGIVMMIFGGCIFYTKRRRA